MILCDFHVHTTFCDGKDSAEDMVLAAIKLGMKKLGFSGHSYTPFDEEPCMSPEDTQRYIQEVHRLREKYCGQIEILCGTECDYYSDIDAKSRLCALPQMRRDFPARRQYPRNVTAGY